jgi:hypothetical protein
MKVFVSSVISRYEHYREVARSAIMLVGSVPVMAEYDFGAKPISPRDACLEGVRESDVYVGLFGEQYGYITDEETSATEEEFEEARRRGLEILIFEERIEKEAKQESFLNKIKGYEEGYFIDFYEKPDQLKDKIIKALVNLQTKTMGDRRKPLEVATLFQKLVERSPIIGTQAPWIAVDICPSLTSIQFILPTDLGKKEVMEKLLQAAMFGESAILSPELGYREILDEEFLRFIQPPSETNSRVEKILEVFIDGTVQLAYSLAPRDSRGWAISRQFLIDENLISVILKSSLSYLSSILRDFDKGGRINSFFWQVRLGGITNKMLGKIPKPEPTSFTVPMHGLPEPLVVPKLPQEITRSDLNDPTEISNGMVDLVRRQFVLGGAYFREV